METERINFVKVGAGLCFVALGILLLLERSGFIELRQIVRFWPLALVVMGAALAWQASRGESTNGAAPGLIWLLILGLAFNYAYDRRMISTADRPPGTMNVFSMMTDNRPVAQGVFTGGQVTTLMGRTGLDLRQAAVPPGQEIVVDLFTMMGGTDIYVPAHWQVEVRSTAVAAGVRDRRGNRGRDDEDADEGDAGAGSAEAAAPAAAPPVDSVVAVGPPPRLILQGLVLFGGVTVRE